MAKIVNDCSVNLPTETNVRGLRVTVEVNADEYRQITIVQFDEVIRKIEFLDEDGKICNPILSL